MRSLLPRLVLPVLVCLAMLAITQQARAAVPVVVGERLAGCGGGRGGGERDAAGNLYFTCRLDAGINRASIRVYDANGILVRRIAAPAVDGNAYFNDVVPSPDGAFLYVSTQSHKFWRLKRQGDTYVQDAGFRFEDFQYGPLTKTPMGEFLSIDRAGNVYLANGTWVADILGAPMVVLKYDANGKFLSQFGEWGNRRALGEFYWLLTDLAATPDGVSVYTTEVGNNRVQRWEQQFGTQRYVAKEAFGNTAADDRLDDPNQAGDQSRVTICGVPGKFGAPYASGLDEQGNLYVLQTNCDGGDKVQVQRRENGVWSILTTARFNGNDGEKPHAMSIDAKGNIYVPSVQTVLRVTGYQGGERPQPPADATAPELRAATLPITVATRDVTIALDVVDNVGVVDVRAANEGQDVTAMAWKPYAAQLVHQLSAGDGAKTVSIQLRDAAGNVSVIRTATTALMTPAQEQPNPVLNAAPVLNGVAIPVETSAATIAVAIDATDDVAVTQMRLATEDGDWMAWQPFAAAGQFALTPGLGNRGVFVQVRDAQGLESRSLYRTIRVVAEHPQPPAQPEPPVDATAPELLAVTLPVTVQTRDMTIALDATDNVAVAEVRVANENGDIAAAAWRPYSAQHAHQLTAGDGPKTVRVQVRDAAGNGSAIRTATTMLITPAQPEPPVQPQPPVGNVAPRLLDVQLPNPANTQIIDVTITASDDTAVTEMRLATETGNWGAWQAFAPRVRFTLTAGPGARGVFVQVRDAQRVESASLYRTTVRANLPVGENPPAQPPVQPEPPVEQPPVKPEPPAGAPVGDAAPVVTALTLPATTATQLVRIRIAATDDRRVTHMRLANEDGNWKPWAAYAADSDWLLTPNAMLKGTFVQVRDEAGHISNVVFKTTVCTPCHAPAKLRIRTNKQPAIGLVVRSVARGSSRLDRPRPNEKAQNFDFSQEDHKRDVIDCGRGFDTVLKRAEDVTRNCERVTVVKLPRG